MNMKRALLIIGALVLAGTSNVGIAKGDPAAGKAKAAACAGCHGANGEGKGPNPALAGKSEDDIEHALKDYKSGKRANAVMKSFAAKLSDQDIENIAEYYSTLKK
jgi:cytochrome c553